MTGDNTPYDGSGAPYPAISFGHGFLASPELYRSTLEHLATWGYFVVAPETNNDLYPFALPLSEAIRYCLTYLEQQNINPTSWLFGQVDVVRFGVSGHSMGGGASILAAAEDNRIKVVVNLAAAETVPSAIQASSCITVPHMLVSGSEDIITPIQIQQYMYDAGFAPKLLPIIRGGSHHGFADCPISGCSSGSLPWAIQLQITRRLLTAFFELYLRNRLEAWDWVWGNAIRQDPLIQLIAESGIAIEPDQTSRYTPVPRIMFHRLLVRNASRYPQRYAILIEGHRWSTEARPNTTPIVQPGGSFPIVIAVRVPRVRPPAQDVAYVRALSLRDGGTMAVSSVRTVYR
jgi:pimeloyl-ACP methyl ester carboxylesterase